MKSNPANSLAPGTKLTVTRLDGTTAEVIARSLQFAELQHFVALLNPGLEIELAAYLIDRPVADVARLTVESQIQVVAAGTELNLAAAAQWVRLRVQLKASLPSIDELTAALKQKPGGHDS